MRLPPAPDRSGRGFHDPGVMCHTFHGLASWMQGDTEAAMAGGAALRGMIPTLAPFDAAYAWCADAVLHTLAGDAASASASALRAMAVSKEQAFPAWQLMGSIIHGWAGARQGNATPAVAQMLAGFDALVRRRRPQPAAFLPGAAGGRVARGRAALAGGAQRRAGPAGGRDRRALVGSRTAPAARRRLGAAGRARAGGGERGTRPGRGAPHGRGDVGRPRGRDPGALAPMTTRGADLNDDPLRIRFILVAMGLVVASNVTGALTHAGPRFALASTMFTFAVMVGWTAWRRDPVLARWLLPGFIAGWLEILTDAWLVRYTASLLYPPDEPMVLDSPLYMPFAWTLVLAQLGVLGAGWRSACRWPRPRC
ncbi:hypothetical protein HK414_13645 [Ramlibacter terrae]|uniref:DUF6989 domain-containing protein n=1 Tax=Ramlibacter terrae TaxID=2732511 RepID=A0ABX6P307_9BURK|nr:hypothetical protein HK414_13645 [Ramlibacter terrae]